MKRFKLLGLPIALLALCLGDRHRRAAPAARRK
jgi:hypothetical protein